MKRLLFGTVALTIILLGGLNNSSHETQGAQKVTNSSSKDIIQYSHGDAW